MKQGAISRATMGRLPSYLSYVKSLPIDTVSISAAAIARGLDLGEVQVRKDLSAVCGAGKPKVGYDAEILSKSIESALGTHSECEAVILGAGKLGMALLGFGGFEEYGITVTHAFDINASQSTNRVLPIEELTSYCSLHQVEIGIIAVPPDAAQSAADMLIKSGVKAILCFAAAKLKVPDNVTVQYENMALSLAHLHQKVKNIH